MPHNEEMGVLWRASFLLSLRVLQFILHQRVKDKGRGNLGGGTPLNVIASLSSPVIASPSVEGRGNLGGGVGRG